MRYTFSDLVELANAIDAVEKFKADLAQFHADNSDGLGVVNYLDVSTGDAFSLPPEVAIDYFRRKGLQPTLSWADMVGEAHDRAFTVAKMTNIDLLSQVRSSLDAALAAGVASGKRALSQF